MEELVAKLIRILNGEEGPKCEGVYAEDARYTYPKRIALAREVAFELKNLLSSKSGRPVKTAT